MDGTMTTRDRLSDGYENMITGLQSDQAMTKLAQARNEIDDAKRRRLNNPTNVWRQILLEPREA